MFASLTRFPWKAVSIYTAPMPNKVEQLLDYRSVASESNLLPNTSTFSAQRLAVRDLQGFFTLPY